MPLGSKPFPFNLPDHEGAQIVCYFGQGVGMHLHILVVVESSFNTDKEIRDDAVVRVLASHQIMWPRFNSSQES